MNLIGADGNIYAILGRAGRLLRQNGLAGDAEEMYQRVTHSQSYEDALFIISEYVETELSVPQRASRRKNHSGRDAR